MKKLLLYGMLLFPLLTSCQRMSYEDDYCTMPTVNNPDVTNSRGASFYPGMPQQ